MARGLIIVAVLVAACAEPAPPTLAEGTTESALPAAIWPDDPSLVTAVVCPDLDLELIAQTGACTAMLDGDPVTVDVEIDELGAATAAVREELLVLADVADELAARLEADLRIESIQARCARTVIVAVAGRSLDCEASSDDRTIDFDMVLGDSTGAWTIELADVQ